MKKLILVAASLAIAIPAAHAVQPAEGGGRLFAMVDANGDGKLDKAEVTKLMAKRAERQGDPSLAEPAKVDAFMKRADSNGDGAIDKAELEALRAARGVKPAAER